MPKIPTPIQRVRPAAAQKRPVITQVRAAKFTPTRVNPRANLSSAGTTINRAPTNTLAAPAPAAVSAASCTCNACTSLQCLERTRFFAGQLLTDVDLTNEQNYFLAKNRLHNRYLHGWGVVCGLQVTCSDCDGWVTINPGYAIDPCGNDIIVCAAQSFNVLQAIQACSTPASTTANCSPLRYRPAPNCTDAIQKWCITVQYQEQATQMVTPLQQTSSSSGSSCACGCSGSGSAKSSSSGCGCGCSGSSTSSSSASSSSASSSSATAACQPTRIIEGFQFGVCALPTATTGFAPGTFFYQIEQCATSLIQLAEQAPSLQGPPDQSGNPTQLPAQQQYQLVTNYLYTVQQYFAQAQVLTNCQALSKLENYTVPQPNQANPPDYAAIEVEILAFIVKAIFECVCLALLPQCPPNPCDNRVGLACVTVQNGAIQSICHFECRQQLIGYTALQYWLGPIFSAIGTIVSDALERYCCGVTNLKDIARYVPLADAFSTDNFTTQGFTNPAMLNRTISTFVSQKMGATLVNTVNPNLNAIDLRPYLGQSVNTLQTALDTKLRATLAGKAQASANSKAQTQISTSPNSNQLDVRCVDDDPSWDLAATSAASQFAPSAVTLGQQLTVYAKGKVDGGSIVGIEVTDPTRALQLQVQQLSGQLTDMQTTLANVQAQAAKNQSPGTAQ
jgi:hypothetical protein